MKYLPVGVLGRYHVVVQQVAEPLHLGVDSLDYLLLVAGVAEPLHELLPVDELLNAEVAEVEQQVDLLRGQCNIQQTEGMLELQVGDDSFVISVGLLKRLLESLRARPQDILHGLHYLAALGFDVVLVRVDVLQRPRHCPFDDVEILIHPVVAGVVFVNRIPMFRPLAVHDQCKPFGIQGFVTASDLLPDFLDVLVQETTPEDFFDSVGELAVAQLVAAFVIPAKMGEGLFLVAKFGLKGVDELYHHGALPVELAEGCGEVALAEVPLFVGIEFRKQLFEHGLVEHESRQHFVLVDPLAKVIEHEVLLVARDGVEGLVNAAESARYREADLLPGVGNPVVGVGAVEQLRKVD